MSDLNQRLVQLSPEKLALLERRLMEKGASVSALKGIPRREEIGSRPLSFAQERLWFLNQMEPDSPAYNVPRVVRISGDLDVEALRKTIDAIVARHEALRTTLTSVGGIPVQVISECRPVDLMVIDLRKWAHAEREAEVQPLTQIETQRPFDLSRDLMLRATLLRLEEEEHIFLLTMHHIASDGWSMGVLFREMAVLWEAISTGKPSPLPDLPVQYSDFAQWQRDWLQGEVLESQLAYWKQQLVHSPPVLELPTDRPRPAIQTYRGAKQSLVLPNSLTEALKSLSQQEGATLFMTLLAAFQILLHRYTGQDDIVVGSPIAGRTRIETEELIGFFVNTLVLRTSLSGEPTFRELLRRVREVALGAYDHQGLPFEKLVEELRPERNLSHSPLFQAMFVLQNTPMQVLELPGLILSSLEVESGTAKFDLTLSMRETELGLRAYLEYNTDLFDTSTIKRMLGHFQTMIEGVVANPDQPVRELPLSTVAERQQLLVEWNDTKADYPQDHCIHELFEAQVERTPDAVAVVFEDDQLTYRELNRRANQLAHYLRSLDVGPEVLVGICVERSLEMVVGLLGILKAGGAYVPLDPTYPKERLAFMLEDTQARVLLSQERLLEVLPENKKQVVCLDTDWQAISRKSEENPVSGSTGENLAYVIYTSGSTGKPKGVCIPHRAVNRLVRNTNYIELGPEDRVAQASNASFDAATFEIWGALLNGGRLVGFSTEVLLNLKGLAERLREEEISVLFLTTALFNQLAREVPWAFNSVRHLLFGGEAVDPKWVREVLKNSPPKRLLHVYGPTESTTFTSWNLVEDVGEGARNIPIGRPVSNTEIYLLDGNLQLVPIGIAGELCIGGDGLAQGYFNRPDLTAEKFILNPFSDEPGARLYKTGDLAPFLPDGNIEFLGRLDNQVKIRGFRVEPGEIEAVLGQHPLVGKAVVVAREDISGDSLVAYVVPAADGSPTTGELRAFLKTKLPDYMVPAVIEFLDEVPITPNGKLDRRALPEAAQERPSLDAGSILLPGTLEYRLAKLFERTLNVQPVGLDDDFFELGGHSLLAASLFNRIQNEFGKQMPLSTLFSSPTVRQLASSLRNEGIMPPLSSLVTLQPLGNKPPFFCVHGGLGNIIAFHGLVQHLGPDQPLYGLQPQGLDQNAVPYTRIEDMAAHYIAEIRSVQPKGPYFLGGRSMGCWIAFEMAQQFQEQGDEVALVALFDSAVPGYRQVRRHVSLGTRLRFGDKLRKFRPLGPRARVGYLTHRIMTLAINCLEKGGNAPRRCKRLLGHGTWEVAHWVCTRTGRPLPRTLRNVALANRQAMKCYSFQEYQGAVTLFRSDEREKFAGDHPDLGWGQFAADGVEQIAIPGGHNSMWEEPNLSVLVGALKSCLLKGQSPESGIQK